MRLRLSFFTTLPVLALLLAGSSLSLYAASTDQAADKAREAELRSLRDELEQLEVRLESDSQSRDGTAASIDETERQIVTVRERIKATQTARGDVNEKLERLQVEKDELERDLSGQRQHVADLLRSLYVSGERPQLRLLLSEQGPARSTRAMVWYQYIASARSELIASIDSAIARSEALDRELTERESELTALESELASDEAALTTAVAEKNRLLAVLDSRLDQGQQRAKTLKENEKRLVQLIETIKEARRKARERRERLAREAAEKRERQRRENERRLAEAKRKKQEAEQRAALAEQRRLASAAEEANKRKKLRPFDQLKGTLSLPLNAKIIGRFGEPKPRSGVRWEGLMLESEAGKPVRAISDGEVVFAGWFRGYGQLLLIDHGGDYMSLYSHNSEIVKNLGDFVSAGEIVALVGATGGLAHPGLYFEIRKESRPYDPLIWCKAAD